METFQSKLIEFYQTLSKLSWEVKKLREDFLCQQCNQINTCLGISSKGSDTKFLNEKGDFITISFSGFSCTDLLNCSTSNLPEGSNLYFTNNRAISALTGENISIFNNDSGYITSSALAPYLTITSAASTYYPLTNPSAYIALTDLSAGTGISYNNVTGVISNTAPNLPDYIQSISDSQTIDLNVTTSVLTANVRHQDSTSINLSEDASGLKADLATGAAVLNIGYTPENVANKATDFTTVNNTLYPTTQAVSDFIGNPITHLNCFTHLTEFANFSVSGSFLINGNSAASISGGWVIGKQGAAVNATIQPAEAGKPGILRLGTGTGIGSVLSLTAQNIWMGSNAFIYESPIRVQTLSTDVQDYYISNGFVRGSVLFPSDALRVFYNHNTNGGNFVCERISGGIISTINTAVPLTIDTWYTIRIIKYPNGTVEFFINGVSMGAASSTNVPTNLSIAMGIYFTKTIGSTTRTCDFDYAYYRET